MLLSSGTASLVTHHQQRIPAAHCWQCITGTASLAPHHWHRITAAHHCRAPYSTSLAPHHCSASLQHIIGTVSLAPHHCSASPQHITAAHHCSISLAPHHWHRITAALHWQCIPGNASLQRITAAHHCNASVQHITVTASLAPHHCSASPQRITAAHHCSTSLAPHHWHRIIAAHHRSTSLQHITGTASLQRINAVLHCSTSLATHPWQRITAAHHCSTSVQHVTVTASLPPYCCSTSLAAHQTHLCCFQCLLQACLPMYEAGDLLSEPSLHTHTQHAALTDLGITAEKLGCNGACLKQCMCVVRCLHEHVRTGHSVHGVPNDAGQVMQCSQGVNHIYVRMPGCQDVRVSIIYMSGCQDARMPGCQDDHIDDANMSDNHQSCSKLLDLGTCTKRECCETQMQVYCTHPQTSTSTHTPPPPPPLHTLSDRNHIARQMPGCLETAYMAC
eukprot:624859-Pelagomonas_calceolata.AAC.11